MTDFLGVKVNEHGVPIWVPGDRTAQLVFYRLFFETPVGQQLSPFVSSERDEPMMARILQIHRKWYGQDAEITLDSFAGVVQSLLATRDPAIVPPEVVEQDEPEDTTPRDKNGKPLTTAQIKWAEYTKFSNESSMAEINKRRQNDAGFASFVRTNLERQMSQSIDGAGVNLLERPEQKPATKELQDFVLAYNKMPSEEARKLGRADTNPLGFRKFHSLFEQAVAAGLI